MYRSLIFCAAVCVGTCVLAYDHVSYSFGKVVESRITQAAISRAPKWKDTEENPPISARRALEVAKKERDRIDLLLKYDRKVWSWKLEAISLKPFEGGGWYWLIQFEQTGPDIAGGVPFLHIPVLMDGRPAVSEVRDTTNADFRFDP